MSPRPSDSGARVPSSRDAGEKARTGRSHREETAGIDDTAALQASPGTGARRGSPWHIEVEGTTAVPVYLGGKVSLELPYRIRASFAAGFLPAGYVDLINAVVVAVGGYDDDTAEVVRSSLKSSMVLRFHVGWRPFGGYGFVVEAGYGLVSLGGDVATEDLIALATGLSPPRQPVAHRDYDVASTLHMIDIELSYRWILGPGLVLRVGLGFAGTVGAQTKVTPRYTPVVWGPVKTFTRSAENYLDDIYTSYVFVPTITVALGWRPL